MDRNFANIAQD